MMLDLLWAPFLACLVLTAIHVYLGLHVLARGVVFVDLALAQVAALGITVAHLAGHPVQSDAAYWYALAFTLGGAVLFSATRMHRSPIPQEAIIGIVYAVSAAIAILVVDRAPQGSEHIKQLLVGSLLTVTPLEVARLAALYATIGGLHVVVRRPLLEISLGPEEAAARGRRIAWWDLVFYVSFGLVVTSSVRIAGVLLVFSYLIVPAAVAALIGRSVACRLSIGWALGAAVSVLGLWASYRWDLPTGATIVTVFGALLVVVTMARGLVWLARSGRAHGARGLRSVGFGACTLTLLAGLFLVALPRMDHLWLDGLEAAWPVIRRPFLSPGERMADQDSREAIRRAAVELGRARALQQDAQWGTRPLSEEQQERLRQFLAGRAEIAAGDRMVLDTLRLRARERQRLWLGLPLAAAGLVGGYALLRRGRLGRREPTGS